MSESKSPDETLDKSMHIRIPGDQLEAFKKKSVKVTGKPYQMLLREMIEAFNSDRLRIKPTKQQAQLGELYK